MSDDMTAATGTTIGDTSRGTAADALRRADDLGMRTRQASRWYVRYMAVFGVGFGLMTLLLGLGPQDATGVVWWTVAVLVVWGLFVAAMVLWAVRRPVQGILCGRNYVPGWVGTGALYAAALFGGLGRDLPVWAWVLMALVVPVPLVAYAVRVHRSLA